LDYVISAITYNKAHILPLKSDLARIVIGKKNFSVAEKLIV
jgi:hypothetical protein